MSEPSFASNNPFRRKGTNPTVSVGVATPTQVTSPSANIQTETTSSDFDASIKAALADPTVDLQQTSPLTALSPGQAFLDANQAPALEDAKPAPKTKVVKKVRVQSPPPSSPESAPRLSSYLPDGYGHRRADSDDESSDDASNDDDADPFAVEDGEIESEPALKPNPASQPPLPSNRPPANPFSRTLQDLEQESRILRDNDKAGGPATSAGRGATKGGAARGTMDVDAFKRLLLTGQAATAAPSRVLAMQKTIVTSNYTSGDASSMTDASSISRQSIFDKEPMAATASAPQETPRTSHEISRSDREENDDGEESDGDAKASLLRSPGGGAPPAPAPARLRKKPPPPAPSSRHGKMIKVELKDEGPAATTAMEQRRPTSSSSSLTTTAASPRRPGTAGSDVNKPLPLAPARRSLDEDAESIFDREAAGKIPEATPETPLGQRMPPPPAAPNSSGRRPAPAPLPPPRRQGKNESRTASTNTPLSVSSLPGASGATITAVQEAPSVPAPRSSFDSVRSRSDSTARPGTAGGQAPAPPPPRRPNNLSRQSGSFVLGLDGDRSPLGLSGGQTFPMVTGAEHGEAKLSPPPPPPTRSMSTRRPASVRSLEATSRRMPGLAGASPPAAKEGAAGLPPPPPPRQRGGSRGSFEAGRRPSEESGRVLEERLVEEPVVADVGKGVDILADLDALQREVDALRGMYQTGA